ncbi:MAG: peptidoglycan glycosyltransferase [Cyanobium sp. CACIAM 14]|nr:MAG: peptidoglycan glycosyltransferase [Cyanobium sp. CACIAM 14]
MPTAMLEGLERKFRRRSGGSEARLVIQQPGQPDRSHPLHGGLYRIGRSNDNDLVIDHTAVSRRHALLECHDGHWLLSDSQSTNGLWWRGRRVRELLLRDGDVVRFGPGEQDALPQLLFRREGGERRRLLGRCLGLVTAALAGTGGLLLALSVAQMPIRGSLATVRGPLVLYDRSDRPVASVSDRKHRELAGLQGYPPVLIQALLASEDNRFWWHPGVDPIGTARALLTNLLGGRVREGGSTLTQQIARSLYPEQVGQGETLERKWRELLVALQLEARFSKQELLLSYLNRVYLGSVWGFEDAARRFFGRPASRLSLEEAALLVGLLPSPNGYDPCLDPAAALASRNRVLEKMVTAGRVGADQARRARRQPIRLAADACRSSLRRGAPFYTDQVRRDLESLVGKEVAEEGNFLIDTHLDPLLQERVEQVLRQRIDASRSLGVSQGAVVVLDSRSGGIVAIAGGRDYLQSQFNRASMALRQPGSTFKLVPYLVALERGARPEDRIGCGPLDWGGQRFASGCGGTLSLRQALAISSNTAALRLARREGLEAVVRKGRDLGFTSPLAPVPGLALGQSEVTLLELTAAYAAVAADGLWRPPTTIRRLTDAEACAASGASGARAGSGCRAAAASTRTSGSHWRRVMSVRTAKEMRTLLEAVVSGGTGSAAYVGPGSWGKTGTTNDGRDLLFVGFAPQRHWVIGVWLGNDDNSPTAASSALAASLWAEIVRTAPPGP